MEKKRKKDLLILGILRNSSTPLTSTKIAQELQSLGHDISERTVRLIAADGYGGPRPPDRQKGTDNLLGESELIPPI